MPQHEWLLMSLIPGRSLAELFRSLDFDESDRSKLLCDAANLLASIHSMPCEAETRLGIHKSVARLARLTSDINTLGVVARDIAIRCIKLLESKAPPNEPLVFNHGDYGLENLQVSEKRTLSAMAMAVRCWYFLWGVGDRDRRS